MGLIWGTNVVTRSLIQRSCHSGRAALIHRPMTTGPRAIPSTPCRVSGRDECGEGSPEYLPVIHAARRVAARFRALRSETRPWLPTQQYVRGGGARWHAV